MFYSTKPLKKLNWKNCWMIFFMKNHEITLCAESDWQSLIAAFAMVTIKYFEDSKPISKCLSLVPLNGITMSLTHDILIQRSSQVRFPRLFVFSVKTLSIKTNAVSFNREKKSNGRWNWRFNQVSFFISLKNKRFNLISYGYWKRDHGIQMEKPVFHGIENLFS